MVACRFARKSDSERAQYRFKLTNSGTAGGPTPSLNDRQEATHKKDRRKFVRVGDRYSAII